MAQMQGLMPSSSRRQVVECLLVLLWQRPSTVVESRRLRLNQVGRCDGPAMLKHRCLVCMVDTFLWRVCDLNGAFVVCSALKMLCEQSNASSAQKMPTVPSTPSVTQFKRCPLEMCVSTMHCVVCVAPSASRSAPSLDLCTSLRAVGPMACS